MGLFKAEKVEGEKSPLYGKYVILVGCGKSKKAVRSPAAELYTGGLTRMSVEWARRNSDKFFILSAKWSLLHPDEMVSPYNVKMSDLDKDERKAWGGTVKDQMMVHKIDDLNFVVLAGGDYLNALRFKPRNIVYAPMDGLKMGERMKWLKENPVLKKKLLGDRHGAES